MSWRCSGSWSASEGVLTDRSSSEEGSRESTPVFPCEELEPLEAPLWPASGVMAAKGARAGGVWAAEREEEDADE